MLCIGNSFAQERTRVVPNQQSRQTESKPTNLSSNVSTANSRKQTPPLAQKIVIVQNPQPLVKKTGSSQPTNPVSNYSAANNRLNYSSVFNQRLLSAIQTRIGIPYHYSSTGPNSYDCSGLVWSVFNEAGFYLERSSARNLWQNSVPVEGDEKYKFGTLVFFNQLGHIGIVAGDNGFYHASSSKGVTFSKFEGYWAKRIVGYRRISMENLYKLIEQNK
ncbi:MAG: C40 family peptidase [Acidobacteriota bacterium]|nr:C40 family peptidase [Acidobacteriota bacterium]